MDNLFTSKKVLVYGTGVSGQGAKTALETLGASVVICDDKSAKNADIAGLDLIVVSPGVPLTNSVFSLAKSGGVEIIGELELGARIFKGDIIAVTGTNGKTTVTELITDMLVRDGRKAAAAGNIGMPFSVAALKGYDVIALEVSSFQLETVSSFHPHIALITNIADDHLDRHGSIREYARTKFRIAMNQNECDYLVLSADDIPVGLFGGFKPASKVIYASVGETLGDAYMGVSGLMWKGEKVIDAENIRMSGLFNMKNALSAVAAASLYGCGMDAVRKSLSVFDSGHHRLSYVDTVNGKSYYNDSKGTNNAASLAALRSFDEPLLLIAGGQDKNCGYDALFSGAPDNLKVVYAIGESAERVKKSAEKYGVGRVEIKQGLSEAVRDADKESGVGIVLLSPASASFDMFSDYKDRGECFIRAVKELRRS